MITHLPPVSINLTKKGEEHIMQMVKLFEKPTVFGAFEYVSFPEWSDTEILAKVDTGADSGALHCTRVKEKKDSKNNLIIEFSPFGHQELVFRTKDFKVIKVTSSNGQTEKRYKIRTNIEIKGKTYTTNISLADRSTMKYEILIGRKFLNENKILVDVGRNNKESERHK